MQVEAETAWVTPHAGHRYRFCSARCQSKFEAEPDKFLGTAFSVSLPFCVPAYLAWWAITGTPI